MMYIEIFFCSCKMQPSQSCTVYVWNPSIQIAATRLLSVGLCGVLFLALRWSILVVIHSKMLQKCKKLSYTKLRILCWRCTFTSKTLWQMPEPSWLCGNICHCSPFSWGKLLQIKSWWISKYTLHILTFWKTIIQKHHSTNNIKMYGFPVSCYFLHFGVQIFSSATFFSNTPHSMFFSQSERSSFTVLEWWYNHSCVYCNIWWLGYLS